MPGILDFMQNNPQAISGLAAGLLSPERDKWGRVIPGSGFGRGMVGFNQGYQSDYERHLAEVEAKRQEEERQRLARERQAWGQYGQRAAEDLPMESGTSLPPGIYGPPKPRLSAAAELLKNSPTAAKEYWGEQFKTPKLSPYAEEMQKLTAKNDVEQAQSRQGARQKSTVLRNGLALARNIAQNAEANGVSRDDLVGPIQGSSLYSLVTPNSPGRAYRDNLKTVVANLDLELSSALKGQGTVSDKEREIIARARGDLQAQDWAAFETSLQAAIELMDAKAEGREIQFDPNSGASPQVGAMPPLPAGAVLDQ